MWKKKHRLFRTLICLLLVVFIIAGPYYLLKYRPHDVDYRDKNRNNKPQWTGVITFWDYPRLDKKTGTNFGWIREKIKAFEKANPGVYINFRPLNWEKGPHTNKHSSKARGLAGHCSYWK